MIEYSIVGLQAIHETVIVAVAEVRKNIQSVIRPTSWMMRLLLTASISLV